MTLGILGRAQRLYGMSICGFAFLSNHYHLLVWARDAEQLARFVGYLNSKLAREVGRIHAWREKVWGRRYQSIVVSDEEEAQVERLFYLLQQGCKEGLVADPEDWPGATSVRAMLHDEPLVGRWIDRTSKGSPRERSERDDREGDESRELVTLDPLPAWSHLEPTERQRRVGELVTRVRDAAAARQSRHGRPAGAHEVMLHDPHEVPLESSRGSAPWVHAATRARRLAFLAAYRLFVAAFRRAADALRAGCVPVEFPAGCFQPSRGFIRAAPS